MKNWVFNIAVAILVGSCQAEIEKDIQSSLGAMGVVANENYHPLHEKNFYEKHQYPLTNLFNLERVLEQ